jgi:hypothetical protein
MGPQFVCLVAGAPGRFGVARVFRATA